VYWDSVTKDTTLDRGQQHSELCPLDVGKLNFIGTTRT